MNMLDSEVVQDLQYSMDDMEDDMCLGMEMKMMKKRKLTTEQARQLEASFEADKKLEAEKKQRLAEQLGLQPRQVAIWFQNRRARSKTKQLELDFLALKAEYDRVVAQRRSLQAEIANLTAQLQERNAQGKSNLGSADSKSSTNSTNGDVISKSPTTEVEKDSPKEDTEYTSNFEHEAGKSKDAAPIRQDISRSPNVHHYDWEAYEHGLWVFD
ncbi:hypothetical protein KP509_18G080300 [Ceratopteris richardii]|uniref:Homeobox domain-containing protein n=1 Tax=Ceratopteris richardii TaxID=49495 RepID=A0A8T2SV20_CERRI|nr:hypothetical protein KP509_18G080300 [Ceratopteris richardii]